LSSEKSFGFIYLQKYKSLTPTPTKVYALDRLETPSNDFSRIQKRATTELGTSLHYRRIDVRDQQHLNAIVEEIATKHQRLDGLIAAAGIQQETPALEYTAKDSDLMMSINVTGCFMTAQAAAKQMVRFGNGGSVVLIASMSGTIANRVSSCLSPFAREEQGRNEVVLMIWNGIGTHLPRLQRLQSSRHPTRPQPRLRMGPVRHQSQHHLPGLHRNRHGRSFIRKISRAENRMAEAEYAW